MSPANTKPSGASKRASAKPKRARSALKIPAMFGQYLTFALLISGVGFISYQLFERVTQQPVTDVQIRGDFAFVSEQMLSELVAPRLGNTFVRVDLVNLKAELERQVWVDQVSIKRLWPATLVITVIEHRPIARWNDDDALNHRGEVIPVQDAELLGHELSHLPALSGPEGSASKVMLYFQTLREQLSDRGLAVTELTLDASDSWSLALGDIQFELGRDQLNQRMQRFLSVYEQRLQARWQTVESVDLRYRNGLAVSWSDTKPI